MYQVEYGLAKAIGIHIAKAKNIYIYIYIYIVKKILKGVGRRKVNLMMLYFTGKIMANWKKFLFAMLMISFGDISV